MPCTKALGAAGTVFQDMMIAAAVEWASLSSDEAAAGNSRDSCSTVSQPRQYKAVQITRGPLQGHMMVTWVAAMSLVVQAFRLALSLLQEDAGSSFIIPAGLTFVV
jgi:hypothetical protein